MNSSVKLTLTTRQSELCAIFSSNLQMKYSLNANSQLASSSLNQSINEYLQNLKRLGKEGNYAAVTSDEHRQQAIKDAFVAGIYSASIRQRLLESENMNLQRIID